MPSIGWRSLLSGMIYIFVSILTYIHTHTHTHTHIYIYIFLNIHLFIYIYIYISLRKIVLQVKYGNILILYTVILISNQHTIRIYYKRYFV